MTSAALRRCPKCMTPVAQAALGIQDYDWAKAKLPNKVGPMDIDFLLERKGRFLAIEFKPEGVVPGTGQRITLERLRALGMDVWMVWGNGPDVHVGVMGPGGTIPYATTMTAEDLGDDVATWFREASNG